MAPTLPNDPTLFIGTRQYYEEVLLFHLPLIYILMELISIGRM